MPPGPGRAVVKYLCILELGRKGHLAALVVLFLAWHAATTFVHLLCPFVAIE